jgi:ATP-dependent protease ClpP protease subunit
MPADRFRFTAESSELELFIYGSISSWNISARWVAETLRAHPNAKTIKLRINSPGGSVFEGAAIFNLLARHPAKKEVDIDGLAASAASWIVMAGDIRRIGLNGFFMIHEAQGEAWGPASEMEKTAALLRKMNAQQIDIYAKRSKLSRAAIAKAVEEETWYTAAEALKAGFVTATSAELDAADPASALVEVDSQLADFGFRKAPHEALAPFSFAASAQRPPSAPVPDDVLALALSAVPQQQLDLIEPTDQPARAVGSGNEPTQEDSMNKTVLAAVLGIAANLPDDAFEAAIVALSDSAKAEKVKSDKLQASVTKLEALTGKTGEEAHGVVLAWKGSHEELPKVSASLEQMRAEKTEGDLVASLEKAKTESRHTPAREAAVRKLIEDKEVSAKGALAMIDAWGVIAAIANSRDGAQPAPAPTASGNAEATKHNGKTFAEMSPSERAELKKADKALHDQMRAEWIKAGRPETQAA